MYLLTVPEERVPKVTASYSLVPPSSSNQFSSSVEDAVIEKVDFEKERDAYIERIRRAVNRLTARERQMVIRKYFGRMSSLIMKSTTSSEWVRRSITRNSNPGSTTN